MPADQLNGAPNGNRNGPQWRLIAIGLVILLSSALGWLFFTVIELSITSAANARSVSDLWVWVHAIEQEDAKWKDKNTASESAFQAEVRAMSNQSQSEMRANVTHITDILTELRIRVGDLSGHGVKNH